MAFHFSFGWKTIFVAIFAVISLGAAAVVGADYYYTQSSFCGGSCHIMTEQYDAWKASKHNSKNNLKHKQAECVACHFAPGEESSWKAKYTLLSEVFTYLAEPEAPLSNRANVKDESCLRSGCHIKERFEDKKIEYTKNVVFKHKGHFGKSPSTLVIEGQELRCGTCHVKASPKKHFEVPKETCYLCHFKKVGFNKERGKCALCHTIPTKSLQSQMKTDDPNAKPITHQTLQEAKVPCESCHLQEIKGEGLVKQENCGDCHNDPADLAKWQKKKLMHEKHVATRKALCFDCHDIIEHKKQPDHLELARANCALCHLDEHKQQKQLLAGEALGENVAATPNLMAAVNTNCMGCHLKTKHSKGHTVQTSDGKACVGCHTPEHDKMLDDWKKVTDKELEFIIEAEKEALQALSAAEGNVSGEKIAEARKMIVKGQEFLDIVRIGNAVHNKKYSIMILDEAFANFEDSIDLLDSGG